MSECVFSLTTSSVASVFSGTAMEVLPPGRLLTKQKETGIVNISSTFVHVLLRQSQSLSLNNDRLVCSSILCMICV